jgi:hypothetical protein
MSEHFDIVVDSVEELRSELDLFGASLRHPVTHTVKSAIHTNPIEADVSSSGNPKTTHRHVSWESRVIDNEHMNKLRTDDEFWDPKHDS